MTKIRDKKSGIVAEIHAIFLSFCNSLATIVQEHNVRGSRGILGQSLVKGVTKCHTPFTINRDSNRIMIIVYGVCKGNAT